MRRLYSRLYLHLLGMAVVVAVVTALVIFTGFRTAWFRNFTERLVEHEARVLADRMDDKAARDRFVRRLASDLDVEITVRDESGEPLVIAGEELPPLDADARARLAGGATAVMHKHRGFYAVAAIVDGKTGAMRGTMQAAPMMKPRPAPYVKPAITLGLVLLIVAVATAPLARRISRPVERLTLAMRRFGAGELAYRVPLGAGFRAWMAGDGRWSGHHRLDEMEQLIGSWNEMADRIERLIAGHKELLANVSHELRSPLSRIRVALELLPREDGSESEARIRDLEGDLGELEQLIDDVLTASRLESTALPARLDTVEVAPLLLQLVERARMDPLTAGREVRVDAAAAGTLIADGALVKRALWNLIENAAKYGAPPITIAAESIDTPEGKHLVFHVRDDGPGLGREDRERVFQAFFRVDKARTPGATISGTARGFGLGLTIAKRVAEVHGGTISVGPARIDGDRERGCDFRLELPVDGVRRASTAAE